MKRSTTGFAGLGLLLLTVLWLISAVEWAPPRRIAMSYLVPDLNKDRKSIPVNK